MPTKAFYQNYMQVISGADLCLEKGLRMPALILIYTLADTFAWVVYGKEEKSSRKRFERWVTNWVFPDKPLPCSATELYAARCAVLHTLTSEASLTANGEARQIAYAWGTATAAKLQASMDALGRADLVAIQVEDLFQAIRDGMAKVIEEADAEPNLRQRLEDAAGRHFVSMGYQEIDQFLERVHGTNSV